MSTLDFVVLKNGGIRISANHGNLDSCELCQYVLHQIRSQRAELTLAQNKIVIRLSNNKTLTHILNDGQVTVVKALLKGVVHFANISNKGSSGFEFDIIPAGRDITPKRLAV